MFWRLQAWWALPVRQRLQFLLILVMLPLVAIVLRMAGFVRCKGWIERLSEVGERRPATAEELDDARRLARLMEVAGRNGATTVTCLRQSLLVHGFLRRRGLQPVLRIGVRRRGAALDAHAWVELEGAELGPVQGDFLPLLEPAASSAGSR